MFKKIEATPLTDMSGLLDNILTSIETTLKPDDILALATYSLSHGMTSIQQSRVPYDDSYKDAVVEGADVLLWDRQTTIDRLHKFIFEDNS